jgi:hypothetical protein
MAIKTFESVEALGEWFGSEVFRAVADDTLFVYDKRDNRWVRYAWTRGQREIQFVEEYTGALPIVTQVYPET